MRRRRCKPSPLENAGASTVMVVLAPSAAGQEALLLDGAGYNEQQQQAQCGGRFDMLGAGQGR